MRNLVDSLTKTKVPRLESIKLMNPKSLKTSKNKGF